MARSTDSAELTLTSCSAERPPAKMPTRSRRLTLTPSGPVPDELDLVVERDPEPLVDRGADLVAEAPDVGGAASPGR